MLRIKRASAGSGKTYELAKTYIKLLLTTKQPEYKRLLKKDESFRESLSSIMAVTFTVKATAEMKQRIVEKLADLSRADKASPEELLKIDYLKELTDDFSTTKDEIAELSRNALRTLLMYYSDFKVQTIDSFFQSILHTFAYEANLDDNFNTEINTDYITSIGLDLALDDLSENHGKSKVEDVQYWLKKIIGKKVGTNKWNVFNREDGNQTLYLDLVKESQRLEKESFQIIKEELLDYFDNPELDFKAVMREVDKANLHCWKPFHEARKEKALILMETLTRYGLNEEDLYNRMGSKLKVSQQSFDYLHIDEPKEVKKGKGKIGYSLKGSTFDRLKSDGTGIGGIDLNTMLAEIDNAYDDWMEAANKYYNAFSPKAEGVKTWLVYRFLIPKLMIVLEIARRKDQYLRITNSLQISDTTNILSRIIGEDETPFVYERMGSRLSHYLIDEFQDTSRMQWANLRPLLQESEASMNENLIIGDAKQSIYRFRNADYTLITGLENEFKDIVYYTQEKEPEDGGLQNTNYRSKPRIVEFNNYVFSRIKDLINGKEPVFSENIRKIYQDCIQAIAPGKTDPELAQGYIEINFCRKQKDTAKTEDDDDEKSAADSPGYSDLPEKIMELKKRGYRFRDIGILVNKHTQGMKVVEVLTQYNQNHPESQIPIISEENLLVAGSLSVRIIVHALKVAAGLYRYETKENPVLANSIEEERILSLLKSLQSLALPSIVEAVAAEFIPKNRRDAEAPFLAAFQDAVIEYSSSRPNDIGSFLKWWKRKGKSLSIISPEDSDGVNLQTIHKSKGLEYKCVIIPDCEFSFTPTGNTPEWKWVKVDSSVSKHELLPPYLPVLTLKNLEYTSHKGEMETYKKEFALDQLNKLYVAFTRAASELYVYMTGTDNSAVTSVKGALDYLLIKDEFGKAETDLLSAPMNIDSASEDRTVVRYGVPATREQVIEERRKEEEKSLKKQCAVLSIKSYEPVVSKMAPVKKIDYPEGITGELNPRTEGTLKHDIMQMLEKPEDLPKSIKRVLKSGKISLSQAEKWTEQLSKAIEKELWRGWFSSDVKVYNERALIYHGATKRPDRFIVTREGNAEIIDYKFGVEENKYDEQIKEYATILKESGAFKSVKAYLWYVEEGRVSEVEV